MPIATLIVAPDPFWQEQLRQGLTNSLSKIHYDLRFAGDLAEAWALFQTTVPRFLIIDADRWDDDALAFIRHIRSRTSLHKMVIVVIATAKSARHKVAAYQSGADNYYVKPIDLGSFAMSYPLLVRLQGK